MASRKMPTARAGNYAAPVDSGGMDPSMKETLGLTKSQKMDKTESTFVKGRGGAASAIEAVRRARRANKKPPLPED